MLVVCHTDTVRNCQCSLGYAAILRRVLHQLSVAPLVAQIVPAGVYAHSLLRQSRVTVMRSRCCMCEYQLTRVSADHVLLRVCTASSVLTL